MLFHVALGLATTLTATANLGLPIPGSDASIGEPLVLENLTLFPIYGSELATRTTIVSFDVAMARGWVSVRERGAEEGAQVGTLVIDNRGEHPVLVLAGTVVKGGRQDRQIGQDFVLAPQRSTDVDAFCVEQGRWNTSREGVATAGRFEATKILASPEVRVAAQHRGDQSEVWAKVAEVNDKNKKHASSGTLLASLDDPELLARRERLATRAIALLGAAPHDERIVGVGYGVDGRIRGARWFVTHDLWTQNRETLLHTIAMDAIMLAEGAARPRALSAADVQSFILELRRAAVETVTETKSLNTNVYRKSTRGYGSSAQMESDGRTIEVTADYMMQ